MITFLRPHVTSRQLKWSVFAALITSLLLAPPARAAEPFTFKCNFGPGPAAPGEVRVLPDMAYSAERGFGFEPGAAVTAVAGPPSFVTSDKPFLFSVTVPEGNYNVTVTLGDAAGESVTTVKAESRRLMLEKVTTARGEFVTRTFVVNVRNSKVP